MTANGTLVGSPSFVTAATGFGQAVSLNGTSQYVSIPVAGPFDFAQTDNWTVEARVKLSSTASLCVLAGSRGPSATTQWWLGISGHQISADIGSNSQLLPAGGVGLIDDGAWHSVALVVSGGGTAVALYVDGTRVATQSISVGGNWTGAGAGGSNVASIGRHATGGNFYWPGQIDELAVTSSALYTGSTYTPATVPFTSTRTGQVGLYHLDSDATDSSSLAVAAPTLGTCTTTTVALTSAAPSGGVSPYTYQWHRSLISGFTPAGGTALTSTGATTSALTDSPPDAQLYFYKVVVTDSGGTPSSVTSGETPGALFAAALVVGYIGDSITQGFGPSSSTNYPVNVCAAALAKLAGVRSVTTSNRGISGTTSADWTPSSGTGYYTAARSAFASAGVQVVHLMLGTNDCKAAVATSAAAYQANLAAICADLVSHGYTVIVSAPPYTVPGSSSNAWTEGSVALLAGYQTAAAAVCNGTTILLGDTLAYTYFGTRPSELTDGIHPTDVGGVTHGLLWAQALVRATLGVGPSQQRPLALRRRVA